MPESAQQGINWCNKGRKCEIRPGCLLQRRRERRKVSGYITRTESAMQADAMPYKPKQQAINLANTL